MMRFDSKLKIFVSHKKEPFCRNMGDFFRLREIEKKEENMWASLVASLVFLFLFATRYILV